MTRSNSSPNRDEREAEERSRSTVRRSVVYWRDQGLSQREAAMLVLAEAMVRNREDMT